MSAKEWRDKGNKAYQDGRWDDAIVYYSKSLQEDATSYLVFSNRSAAYLKLGDFENSLKDANTSIELKKDYHKAYGRKGAAYHAMKEFGKAINCYKKGLELCPDDSHLLKGLAAAKKARTGGSRASRAVVKTQASTRATASQSQKAKRAQSVSVFVKQTRMELNLQLSSVQAQLDLIDELVKMSSEEKHDLLFGLIDSDGDGTVDARELAAALRKRNADMSFSESIERAIDMVAVFDKDGDARLDPEEFSGFIDLMLQELQISFDDFAEFLVLQILFREDVGNTAEEEMVGSLAKINIDEAVKEREELFDMLTNPRMTEIFQLFDVAGMGLLTFKQVAIGLYPVACTMDGPTKTTMCVLLMMEKNDQRTLNYEQFGRLVMGIVAAAKLTFDDIADAITLTLTSSNFVIDEKAATDELTVSDAAYDGAMLFKQDALKRKLEEAKQQQNGSSTSGFVTDVDALSFGRLQKLFDLWDINGDGDITLNELMRGLEKFQAAAGIVGRAQEEARVLMGFDEDGDHALDRTEFAKAMIAYGQAFHIDLRELIDFMCVTTVLSEENRAGFQSAYGKAFGQHQSLVMPAHMSFPDQDDDDFFLM